MMKKTSLSTFSSQKHSSRYGIRSISLPTRSHPSTIRIEEELNKLKSWETSSSSKVEKICYGLSGLGELYKCVEDLLKLPLTQQALGQYQSEKWVDELLEYPVRFLDILGETRDAIMSMKGGVIKLQSALRRRKIGDLGMETHISSYWSLRRNMRKECTKSMLSLRQIDQSFEASTPFDLDHHLSSIVRVLREASWITTSIFQSLVVFLSSPIFRSRHKSKWSFVSRVVQKGLLVCNNQHENINELEKVDLTLSRMVMDSPSKDFEAEKIQSAHRELEAVVLVIEVLESGLDCLFKHLINTRVSFLNILSP
ncbi:hypothetical protein Lal_00027418 [Lupinus albus]|uniref:Uncharacterized protein n=1 Tax=Lupinus albus TaxID=3870 RepID=A0A6A4QF30_LUPAL|nr:hypothetical protein Lalb_Chr05g0212021 [Lupinus albus]KAF1873380.1 hypothetical protein Lal_00027418 [Lupinus albus]